jgi:hypothetical protein
MKLNQYNTQNSKHNEQTQTHSNPYTKLGHKHELTIKQKAKKKHHKNLKTIPNCGEKGWGGRRDDKRKGAAKKKMIEAARTSDTQSISNASRRRPDQKIPQLRMNANSNQKDYNHNNNYDPPGGTQREKRRRLIAKAP